MRMSAYRCPCPRPPSPAWRRCTLHSPCPRPKFPGRKAPSGFSLVELITVLALLTVLMALAIPAILQARTAARRTSCQNNLRQLSLAVTQFVGAQRRLPAAGYWGDHRTRGYAPLRSWVVDLLPWLDQGTIANQWQLDEPCVSPANQQLAQLKLSVLACPDDLSVRGAGDLSYAVNGGWGFTQVIAGRADCPVNLERKPLDLNGDGAGCDSAGATRPLDAELFFQTGMFFGHNWPLGPQARFHTLDDVSDGLSQTFLILENVRTGADSNAPSRNWSTPLAELTSVFLPPGICEANSCGVGRVDYSRANVGPRAINGGLLFSEGQSPTASSYHTGGVLATFGDGQVRFVSQRIAGRVYAALFSPQGGHIRGPLAQEPVGDSEY